MERYVKRPIVVQAERWVEVTYDREAGHGFGGHSSPVYHLDVGFYRHPDNKGTTLCKNCGRTMHFHGWIDTLEGGHTVCPGDWIIEGIAGELYPCKPDIFDSTYEKYCPTDQKEVLDEDVASAAPVLDLETDVGSSTPSEDDIGTGCYEELVDLGFDEKNPAHYCFGCDKYLGFRGFCSDKCHNEHYDAEQIDMELETLEILSDNDIMAGIRKSMEQINNGEGIPLSELYPKDKSCVPRDMWIDEKIARDSLVGKYG